MWLCLYLENLLLKASCKPCLFEWIRHHLLMYKEYICSGFRNAASPKSGYAYILAVHRSLIELPLYHKALDHHEVCLNCSVSCMWSHQIYLEGLLLDASYKPPLYGPNALPNAVQTKPSVAASTMLLVRRMDLLIGCVHKSSSLSSDRTCPAL
eukprot:c20981_g1_i1 orf=27-485(-)